jgi:hypothetical protein
VRVVVCVGRKLVGHVRLGAIRAQRCRRGSGTLAGEAQELRNKGPRLQRSWQRGGRENTRSEWVLKDQHWSWLRPDGEKKTRRRCQGKKIV